MLFTKQPVIKRTVKQPQKTPKACNINSVLCRCADQSSTFEISMAFLYPLSHTKCMNYPKFIWKIPGLQERESMLLEVFRICDVISPKEFMKLRQTYLKQLKLFQCTFLPSCFNWNMENKKRNPRMKQKIFCKEEKWLDWTWLVVGSIKGLVYKYYTKKLSEY